MADTMRAVMLDAPGPVENLQTAYGSLTTGLDLSVQNIPRQPMAPSRRR